MSSPERLVLALLGAAALTGLGTLAWMGRPLPLAIEQAGAPAQAPAWDAALETARRIDVNAALAEELARIPGIGPRLAQRIVEERTARGPFAAASELARVEGIGPKTVDAMAPYVTVE